ncbi:hypothetical protein O3P69_012116 [Scylla paramamosain]|uniref:Uncharacterized protein n=1 Tax=Scylla paramamosain TaxID=85552 RepID=A0AAW0TBQ7_SCYPA
MDDDRFPQLAILCHMFYSQDNSHPPSHTSSTFFFGLPTDHQPPTLTSSTLLNTTPYALLTCPNHLSLLFLSSTERSATPNISATSPLDLPSCHPTPAMYLTILQSQLRRISHQTGHLAQPQTDSVSVDVL